MTDKIKVMNQKKDKLSFNTTTKKTKRGKYMKATRTIGKSTDDTKGLRAGNEVRFPINRVPDAELVTGTLARIFVHLKNNPPKNEGDEEARIIGPKTDSNPYGRYFRDLDEIEKVDK